MRPEEIEHETTLSKDFELGIEKGGVSVLAPIREVEVDEKKEHTSKKKLSQQALNLLKTRSPGSSWDVFFHWAITSGRWRVETSKVRLAKRSFSPHNARTRALRMFSAGVLIVLGFSDSQVLKGRATWMEHT